MNFNDIVGNVKMLHLKHIKMTNVHVGWKYNPTLNDMLDAIAARGCNVVKRVPCPDGGYELLTRRE